MGCQECVSETVAERIWGGEKGRGGREGSRTGGNVDEDIRDLGDGAGGALGVHQHPPDHRLHEPELEVWAHERRVRHVRFLVQRAVEMLRGRRLAADGNKHAPSVVFRSIRHRGVRLIRGWSCAVESGGSHSDPSIGRANGGANVFLNFWVKTVGRTSLMRFLHNLQRRRLRETPPRPRVLALLRLVRLGEFPLPLLQQRVLHHVIIH